MANDDANAADEDKAVAKKLCQVSWGLLVLPAVLLIVWWRTVMRYFREVESFPAHVTCFTRRELYRQMIAITVAISGIIFLVVDLDLNVLFAAGSAIADIWAWLMSFI
jgi:hypothetical protein